VKAFTDQEVRDIRLEYETGEASITSLSALYGASRGTIHKIIIGRTYKDVDPPRCLNIRPRGRVAGPRPELRKLSLREENEIRQRKETPLALSHIYGVSAETIRKIRKEVSNETPPSS
tara:strand:- start:5782 stop:6135 length:354 start_codon:yes stop_codon:yes gene_type:complete